MPYPMVESPKGIKALLAGITKVYFEKIIKIQLGDNLSPEIVSEALEKITRIVISRNGKIQHEDSSIYAFPLQHLDKISIHFARIKDGLNSQNMLTDLKIEISGNDSLLIEYRDDLGFLKTKEFIIRR